MRPGEAVVGTRDAFRGGNVGGVGKDSGMLVTRGGVAREDFRGEN